MRLGPLLFLVFLLVPLFEIYLLIEVGGIIGVGWTIFAVVFTALLGANLVRHQGFSTLGRIQQQLNQGELPAMELLEGVFLLVAGALLLTPGFFTDAIGFICLTPVLRRLIIRFAISRGVIIKPVNQSSQPQQNGASIEGEFRRIDD